MLSHYMSLNREFKYVAMTVFIYVGSHSFINTFSCELYGAILCYLWRDRAMF